MEKLAGAMSIAKQVTGFKNKEGNHRRGGYATINTGISFGGGSKASRRPRVPQKDR